MCIVACGDMTHCTVPVERIICMLAVSYLLQRGGADPAMARPQAAADPVDRPRAADPAARPRVPETISWALSSEDVKSGLLLFEALDADSDGFVTKDDFLTHLSDTAPPAIARRLVSVQGSKPTYEEDAPLFRMADIDKDGKLIDTETLIMYRAALYIGSDDSKLIPYPPSTADVGVLRTAIDKANMTSVADSSGNTPIHLAANVGAVPTLKLFVDDGCCNPNVRNLKGERPLHLAALEGHFPAVQALLESGANAKSTDKSGRSPLDCALMAGKSRKIEAALRAAGGSSSWWEAERVRRALAAKAEAERVAREAERAAREAKESEMEAKSRAATAAIQLTSIDVVRRHRAERKAARAAADKSRNRCLCVCYSSFMEGNPGDPNSARCAYLLCACLPVFDLVSAILCFVPWTLSVWVWRACEPRPDRKLSRADRAQLRSEEEGAPVSAV